MIGKHLLKLFYHLPAQRDISKAHTKRHNEEVPILSFADTFLLRKIESHHLTFYPGRCKASSPLIWDGRAPSRLYIQLPRQNNISQEQCPLRQTMPFRIFKVLEILIYLHLNRCKLLSVHIHNEGVLENQRVNWAFNIASYASQIVSSLDQNQHLISTHTNSQMNITASCNSIYTYKAVVRRRIVRPLCCLRTKYA